MALLFLTGVTLSSNKSQDIETLNRNEKMLSVFQIVTFPNDGCNSNDGDYSEGTCITAAECSARGGRVSGTCATGFGACCLITTTSCGGTISYNNTYITNPEYPAASTTAQTCTWTVPKITSDVCHIRLDFDKLTLANPDKTSDPTTGMCLTDNLVASSACTGNAPGSGLVLSPICGINDGQHIYIDAGAFSSKSASFTMTNTGTTSSREWKIKVSQIECDSETNPPTGCYQYFWGQTGRVKSFNFDQSGTTNWNHLGDQNYKACVRRERGYCKIGWTESNLTPAFKISRPSSNDNSNNGQGGCKQDAVIIPRGSNNGARGSCLTPGSVAQDYVDRYCGGTLNCVFNSGGPSMIVSDQIPFMLEVKLSSADPSTAHNRGFALDYRQLPCTSNS